MNGTELKEIAEQKSNNNNNNKNYKNRALMKV